jgi:hypothetical protein
MRQQLSTARRVDEGHVALVNAHALEECVTDFKFGVDEGVANGVKVVMRHRGVIVSIIGRV